MLTLIVRTLRNRFRHTNPFSVRAPHSPRTAGLGIRPTVQQREYGVTVPGEYIRPLTRTQHQSDAALAKAAAAEIGVAIAVEHGGIDLL